MTFQSSSKSKGKKRATEDIPGGPSVKKPRRAETKQCPVCLEHIPLRLLAAHCDLENERVEEIITAVGSVDVIGNAEDGVQFGRERRSATKARKALQPRASGSTDITDQTGKIIRLMIRHRKRRHSRLREMATEGDGRLLHGLSGTTCPVCLIVVQGDPDVVEAHVDSCLAHAMRVQEEQTGTSSTDGWEEVDIDDTTLLRATDGANLTASGFHVRNKHQRDVEDDVDVDGEDDAVFGHAQFTEIDILSGSFHSTVDAEGSSTSNNPTDAPLRELVASGQILKGSSPETRSKVKRKMDQVLGLGDMEKIDAAVNEARQVGNQAAVIRALETKVKQLESMRVSSSTSSLCRICLDLYVEPTVSILCWHTCCRECWLRCLATRLCPICKKITGADSLRRVYL